MIHKSQMPVSQQSDSPKIWRFPQDDLQLVDLTEKAFAHNGISDIKWSKYIKEMERKRRPTHNQWLYKKSFAWFIHIIFPPTLGPAGTGCWRRFTQSNLQQATTKWPRKDVISDRQSWQPWHLKFFVCSSSKTFRTLRLRSFRCGSDNRITTNS